MRFLLITCALFLRRSGRISQLPTGYRQKEPFAAVTAGALFLPFLERGKRCGKIAGSVLGQSWKIRGQAIEDCQRLTAFSNGVIEPIHPPQSACQVVMADCQVLS